MGQFLRVVHESILTGIREMGIWFKVTTFAEVTAAAGVVATCISIDRNRSSRASRILCSWMSWRFKSETWPDMKTSSSEPRMFVSENDLKKNVKHKVLSLKLKFRLTLNFCRLTGAVVSWALQILIMFKIPLYCNNTPVLYPCQTSSNHIDKITLFTVHSTPNHLLYHSPRTS